MGVLPCTETKVNMFLRDAGVLIVVNSLGSSTEHQLQTSSSFLGPQATGLLRTICCSQILVLPPGPWRDSPCSLLGVLV